MLQSRPIAIGYRYGFIFRALIISGLLAITHGLFLFSIRLRLRYRDIHKRVGYTYFVTVLGNGIAGLIVAQFVIGGWIASLGFTILAVLWLWTSIGAIRAILIGNIGRHQQFMFLSYALTFTAISQRTILLIPLFVDIDFMDIYRLSAWLPWILNLTIAQYIYTALQPKKV